MAKSRARWFIISVIIFLPFWAGPLIVGLFLPEEVSAQAQDEFNLPAAKIMKSFVANSRCWRSVTASSQKEAAQDGGADWVVGRCYGDLYRLRGGASGFEAEWFSGGEGDEVVAFSRLVLTPVATDRTRASLAETRKISGTYSRGAVYLASVIPYDYDSVSPHSGGYFLEPAAVADYVRDYLSAIGADAQR